LGGETGSTDGQVSRRHLLQCQRLVGLERGDETRPLRDRVGEGGGADKLVRVLKWGGEVSLYRRLLGERRFRLPAGVGRACFSEAWSPGTAVRAASEEE